LVNHPVYGKIIKGYRSGGLTMRMKWAAAIAITASLSLSAFVLTDSTVLRIILAAVGVFAIWFVFSRPTKTQPATDLETTEQAPPSLPLKGGVPPEATEQASDQPPLTA
jgi:hypothetical protein